MENLKRKTKKMSVINLPVESDIITSECAGQLVVAILESILFQRNQIPFAFQTFKYLVSLFKNKTDNESDGSLKNLQCDREKDKARDTLQSITDLSATILQHINDCDVSSLRLLIGSTVMTPKEAYIIKLPNISKDHSNKYHKAILDPLIKKTLLTFLTCDHLYEIFSKDIQPTNIYVEMEMIPHSVDSSTLFCKDYFDLPLNCHMTLIHLNLIEPKNITELVCCSRFKILSDIEVSTDDINTLDNSNISNKSLNEYSWFEACTFIRGYNDKRVKGQTIWESK